MSNIPRLCFDGERLYVGLMMKDMISKIFWYLGILLKSRIVEHVTISVFKYSKFKIDPRFALVLLRQHQTLGINYIHDPARLATKFYLRGGR